PLREALSYPATPDGLTPEQLNVALDACGIAHLHARLFESARWDQALSASERQRVAFARAILQRPDIIILDDALTAFDESGQIDIIDALIAHCPNATIVNTGGHGGVSSRFDRQLFMQSSGSEGAILREHAGGETSLLAVVADNSAARR
ncbi:MAG: transporter ATP-binding protein, partial [Hyphomicrobiales bacterium]|nr:transporter ATP-binding protein [Hyphomicrobiales bacterium]